MIKVLMPQTKIFFSALRADAPAGAPRCCHWIFGPSRCIWLHVAGQGLPCLGCVAISSFGCPRVVDVRFCSICMSKSLFFAHANPVIFRAQRWEFQYTSALKQPKFSGAAPLAPAYVAPSLRSVANCQSRTPETHTSHRLSLNHMSHR